MPNDQGNAAVDAYLTDDSTGAFEIAPGCTVNLSEAIERHRHAPTRKALADPASNTPFQRQ